MIPYNNLEYDDDFDSFLQSLSTEYYMYFGDETCECGLHHTMYAPIQLVVAECVCGFLLEFNLEEYDGL